MRIRITLQNKVQGDWELDLGSFPALQITYDVLRDDRGNTIAIFEEGHWFVPDDDRDFTDIFFEIEA